MRLIIFVLSMEFTDFFAQELRDEIVSQMKEERVQTKFEDKNEIINPIIKNIEKIFQLKNQHLLSYFKLKPNNKAYSVDVAILSGLLKSLKPKKANKTESDKKDEISNYKSQLNLCLVWNRFDMVKQLTLTDEIDKVYLNSKIKNIC